MKIKEALSILSNGNPAILRSHVLALPDFSLGKGGRYWFNDECPVSEDEIVALFGLALDLKQQSIEMELGGYEGIADYSVSIKINEDQEYFLPNIPINLATSMYADRSNGYCLFSRLLIENKKFTIILGGELCLDELLAIYTIAKNKV